MMPRRQLDEPRVVDGVLVRLVTDEKIVWVERWTANKSGSATRPPESMR